ncbi:MAG TPA: YqgE/AlgH family protein [Bryobacteraceae bacterium]|nr:YqgE/AlgH family protein [Bryobacteraceae bacterium]
MRWLPAAVAILLLQGAWRLATAQSTRPEDLGAGKLLVASRDLPDPNFAKTVVLLVQYDVDGVVGLIVNRRSKVPVSRVLEGVAGAKDRADLVYAGGPVGRTEVVALVRSRRAPEDATRVLGDVFLVSAKEALEQVFGSAMDADKVRVYLGYAGWTAPQLENELDLGAWYIFPGSVDVIYDADPDSLWPRMIRRTELRIASIR